MIISTTKCRALIKMKAKLQYGFNLINIYMCCVLQSEACHCVLVHASCSLSDSVCNVSERFTRPSFLHLLWVWVTLMCILRTQHATTIFLYLKWEAFINKTETLWFSAKSFSKVWHLKNEEIKIDRHKYKYCNFTVVIKNKFSTLLLLHGVPSKIFFKGLTFEKLRN